MNKEELLKQLEGAKNQIAKLQSDLDKMQNAVDANTNSLPEFYMPKRNEKYYFIDTSELGYFGEPSATKWYNDAVDFMNVMTNNVFRTEEECETEIDLLGLFTEIKETALHEDELIPKDKVLDTSVDKYIIKYDCSGHAELYCFVFSELYQQGIIPNCFFKTSEFTEKIIKEYGERIKALLNKKY